MIAVQEKTLRGYWLTDVGQRITGWVPAGTYESGPAAEVNGRRVVALVRDGFAWHVAAEQVERCTTCTRLASDPFIRRDPSGSILYGCIDACHGPHCARLGRDYYDWWNRPVAADMRDAEAQRRQG